MVGGSNPNVPERVFLGVRVFNYYPPRGLGSLLSYMFPWHLYNFLNWFETLSISAALINMLPIPFFDGGRFFETVFKHSLFSERGIAFLNRRFSLGDALLGFIRGLSILLLVLNVSQSLSLGFIVPT